MNTNYVPAIGCVHMAREILLSSHWWRRLAR